MFKTLACVLVVAVVASNAQNIHSGSTNTGLNLLSSGSNVLQSDVQNVRDGAGYGPYYGNAGYQGYSGYAAHPYYATGYGYDAAYGYGYAPYAGYGAYSGYGAYPGYAPSYGYNHYAGYGDVNSASSNTGANIMSQNSNVQQHQIQNVDRY